MQGGMDRMSQACDNYDLTFSTKKTEVERQPALGRPYSQPTITVEDHKLLVIENSPIREALFPEQCTVMMRLLPELPKPVWLLADFVQMSGSGIESDLTLS